MCFLANVIVQGEGLGFLRLTQEPHIAEAMMTAMCFSMLTHNALPARAAALKMMEVAIHFSFNAVVSFYLVNYVPGHNCSN
jgi:hypothetical protein